MFARICRGTFALLLCVSITGCSQNSGPRCHPVRGTVIFQGQPVAEATVVFHPVTPPAKEFQRPTAQTDANGAFQLTTFKSHDGAPEGEYIVTVELREFVTVGEEQVRDGKHLLPLAYTQPASSPFKVRVEPKTNELPPLELAP